MKTLLKKGFIFHKDNVKFKAGSNPAAPQVLFFNTSQEAQQQENAMSKEQRKEEIKKIIANINVGNLQNGDIALSDVAGDEIINEAVNAILQVCSERIDP